MTKAAATRRSLAAAIALGLLALLVPGGQATALAAEVSAAPKTYLFLVFSEPLPGDEAAYARWFAERRHLARAAKALGAMDAQHYVPGPELRHTPIKTPHDLVLYTLATDQPQAAADMVARLAAAGDAWPGPDIATVTTATYSALGSPLKGVGGEPAGAKPGAAARYAVLAFHSVATGQDDSFNSWYDTVHLPELLANPGVVSGQRGVRSPVQFGPAAEPSPRYLMLLRIATSDVPAVFGGILKGGPPSPAIDRVHSYGFTYQAVSP